MHDLFSDLDPDDADPRCTALLAAGWWRKWDGGTQVWCSPHDATICGSIADAAAEQQRREVQP